jgi:hypothetical protein
MAQWHRMAQFHPSTSKNPLRSSALNQTVPCAVPRALAHRHAAQPSEGNVAIQDPAAETLETMFWRAPTETAKVAPTLLRFYGLMALPIWSHTTYDGLAMAVRIIQPM